MALNFLSRDAIKSGETGTVAFLTPKRLGGAVQRNQLRRRMREIYRRHLAQPSMETYLVWIARAPALELDFEELKKCMTALLERSLATAKNWDEAIMRRFAWFDCLRCVAILLVMAAHCKDIAPTLSPALGAVFAFTRQIGWVGVDLFFVLSGFLVSGLLFDEHDATGVLDIKRFLIRRAFKIIPAFYFLTLVTVIYDAIAFHRVVVVHLIHDIFFLQSYRPGMWSHAWTLAIEVHFYILLAVLLYYLSKTPAEERAMADPAAFDYLRRPRGGLLRD